MTNTKLEDNWGINEGPADRIKNKGASIRESIPSRPEYASQWQSPNRSRRSEIVSIDIQQGTISFEVVIEVGELSKSEDEDLPFDPSDFDRSDIEEYLWEASDYPDTVQEKIYQYSKRYYIDADNEPTAKDIINISHILSYAEAEEYDGWIPSLEEKLEEYFRNEEINRELISRAIKHGDSISPRRAQEIYDQETERIEDAIESTYNNLPAEERKNIIKSEKKEALWKITQKVEY